jgi:UrcA family protein
MTAQFFGASLIGATLLCAGLAACAQNGGPAPSVRTAGVTYDDLDLATSEGAAAAMTRIETAAAEACAWARDTTFGGGRAAVCKDAFIKDAVADADAPVLTALYENSRPAER